MVCLANVTLEKDTKNYFERNIPLIIEEKEEELFQDTILCWLCENSIMGEKVTDHDHITGKYRGAACNDCNLNVKQKQSSFFPIFFRNFSGLIFEELLTEAYNQNYKITTILKTIESYV